MHNLGVSKSRNALISYVSTFLPLKLQLPLFVYNIV